MDETKAYKSAERRVKEHKNGATNRSKSDWISNPCRNSFNRQNVALKDEALRSMHSAKWLMLIGASLKCLKQVYSRKRWANKTSSLYITELVNYCYYLLVRGAAVVAQGENGCSSREVDDGYTCTSYDFNL